MYSKALNREVSIGIIAGENYQHILILLHGYQSGAEDISEKMNLYQIAVSYHCMIVIPNLDNGYYINHVNYDVSGYLGEELPDYIRENFDQSEKCDFLLAGISMGGYGALLQINKNNPYRVIVPISGAFIAHDVVIGNPEVVGQSFGLQTEYFLNTFAPIETLDCDADRNPVQAIQDERVSRKKVKVYLTCGTADLLYSRNREVCELLKKKNMEYVFLEIEQGEHNYLCFEKGLIGALSLVKTDDISL